MIGVDGLYVQVFSGRAMIWQPRLSLNRRKREHLLYGSQLSERRSWRLRVTNDSESKIGWERGSRFSGAKNLGSLFRGLLWMVLEREGVRQHGVSSACHWFSTSWSLSFCLWEVGTWRRSVITRRETLLSGFHRRITWEWDGRWSWTMLWRFCHCAFVVQGFLLSVACWGGSSGVFVISSLVGG